MLAEKFSLVDTNSKVSEKVDHKEKIVQTLAQTTLALNNRSSEKLFLEENEIKIGQHFFVEEICKTQDLRIFP